MSLGMLLQNVVYHCRASTVCCIKRFARQVQTLSIASLMKSFMNTVIMMKFFHKSTVYTTGLVANGTSCVHVSLLHELFFTSLFDTYRYVCLHALIVA